MDRSNGKKMQHACQEDTALEDDSIVEHSSHSDDHNDLDGAQEED